MATLVINSSSSRCDNCGRGASPREDGHYTVYSYSKEEAAKPGCGELWDRVSIPYCNGNETGEQMIHRLKYEWGYATLVPDDNWHTFSWGTL